MHLGHVAYGVKNLEATLDFYCKGLGFTKWFDIKNDAGEATMIYLRVNEREFIEIFPMQEDQGSNGSYRHLCLHTDDIEKELAGLSERGIVPEGPVKKGMSGSLQAWLTDPDGNRIELMQLLPDSMHLTGRRSVS
jgi:lactoylglutathione lyase